MPMLLGEVFGSRSHSKSVQGTGVSVPERKGKQTLYVISDNLDQTEEDVQACPGVPQLYSTYNGKTVNGLDGQVTNTVMHPITGVPCDLWEITVSFTDAIDSSQQNQNDADQDDPTNLRQEVEWDAENEDEIMAEDTTGTAVVTGAGEQLIVQQPMVLPLMTITRYENYPFDEEIIYKYVNHTNSKPFRKAPKGCVVIRKIQAKEETVKGKLYCKVTYHLLFKIRFDDGGNMLEDTFKLKILHAGHRYRVLADDTIRIAKANGDPLTLNIYSGPQPFSAEYDPTKDPVWPSGGYKLDTANFPPQYLIFYKYYEADFDQLNFIFGT